jgi:hypothetical protein
LIEEETNLGAMIEAALRQNAREDEEAAAHDDDIVDDVEVNLDDIEKSI